MYSSFFCPAKIIILYYDMFNRLYICMQTGDLRSFCGSRSHIYLISQTTNQFPCFCSTFQCCWMLRYCAGSFAVHIVLVHCSGYIFLIIGKLWNIQEKNLQINHVHWNIFCPQMLSPNFSVWAIIYQLVTLLVFVQTLKKWQALW